jgi:hypothetical protein
MWQNHFWSCQFCGKKLSLLTSNTTTNLNNTGTSIQMKKNELFQN